MPLENYGFYRGTLKSHYLESPDNQGQYRHFKMSVDLQGTTWEAAVDVDSGASSIGVEWRILDIKAHELQTVLDKGPGYHDLATNSTSGAIDYIRSPMFAGRLGCVAILAALFDKDWSIAKSWKKGTGDQAYADVKPFLDAAVNRTNGLLVFGEPYDTGLGLHNIHQNQGDPLGSDWELANGVWQDGCCFFQQNDDTWTVFMNKFDSQSYKTHDTTGHPLP